MHQCITSPLAKIIGIQLVFSIKPLPETMLTNCKLDHRPGTGTNYSEIEINLLPNKSFYQKLNLKILPAKQWLFCSYLSVFTYNQPKNNWFLFSKYNFVASINTINISYLVSIVATNGHCPHDAMLATRPVPHASAARASAATVLKTHPGISSCL